MIVVTPRTKAVERRHIAPDQVAIAQPAAFLKIDRVAEVAPRFLEELVDPIRRGVARPWRTFRQDLDSRLAMQLRAVADCYRNSRTRSRPVREVQGGGISSCLQMPRTGPSLISRCLGTLVILQETGLNQIVCARLRRTTRSI